ncbi:MAG: CPBP family glutamic-type intramembrane protease, partial [Clostridiales bacterium]|nr:CPBP family glutamic-type intramembrane protease [Clostridiales bacterium]
MNKIINWKTFFILFAGCLITSIMVIPYTLALSPALAQIYTARIFLLQVVQNAVIFALACFFGLLLADKTGFKLPVLESTDKWASLKPILKPSIIWGAISGVLIVLLSLPFMHLSLELLGAELPVAVWKAFFASFYGGIAEEAIFRLFMVSLFVWLALKIKIPKNISVWLAIILSAVIFGLGHLGITSELTVITAAVVIRAIVLNSAGAIIFGWLYWK